jgi:putative MATE family efflux protein
MRRRGRVLATIMTVAVARVCESAALLPAAPRPAVWVAKPIVGRRFVPRPYCVASLAKTAGDDGLEAASPSGSEPRTPSIAALFGFLVPVLASSLTSDVMSVVDTAVVGRFGSTVELASLAPAVLVADTSAYLFSFLTVATMSLVASALARERPAEGFEAVSNAQALALAIGLTVAALVGFNARALLGLALGVSSTPAVLASALAYLQVRLVGLPFVLISMVTQSALQATKDTRLPFLAVVGGGLMNLALDLFACMYLRMGIVGAAYATLASQVTQALLLLAALGRRRRTLCPELPARGASSIFSRPSKAVLRAFVSFAGPLFFVSVGKSVCYNMMTLAVTSSGLLALAAHQVLTTIFFMSCKVGDSISQATQAFLPASLSADGKVTAATVQLGQRVIAASVVAGLVTATLAALVASRGASFFTPDAAVLANIAAIAPCVFWGLSIHSLTMCSEGILLALRDLDYLVGGYALNIIVFVSGLLYVKAHALGLSVVWQALVLFQLARFCQFMLRASLIGVLPIPRLWWGRRRNRPSSVLEARSFE